MTVVMIAGCRSPRRPTGSIAGKTEIASTSPALFNRTTFEYSSKLDFKQEAARYQFMILTSLDASKVAALHAANPRLKILMYSMALYSDTGDPHAYETCSSYSADNAHDPGWFLLNQNGHRLPARIHLYMMDLADTGYQRACVAHAIALAKRDGFNGIFFDGLNSFWKGFVASDSTVVKYPTKRLWQAALQSFLDYAGKTVQARGLMAFANIGDASHSLWRHWTAPMNGAMEQGFTDGGDGLAQQIPYFSQKLGNDAWSEAHHKYALEDSYNRTEAGNTFGLAAMMLVADGYSSWSTSNSANAGSPESWYPEYTDAEHLGPPMGSYRVLSNGVYERKFKNGIVLVDSGRKAVAQFSLGGTYHGATTPSTTSVSLPGTSGLILLTGP